MNRLFNPIYLDKSATIGSAKIFDSTVGAIMAHPDADTPIDPAYFLMGYNLAKCAQCGVAWDEHARDLACDRYRPPAGLGISSLPEVKKIVAVNLTPDSCFSGSPDHGGFEVQSLWYKPVFTKFSRIFRLLR